MCVRRADVQTKMGDVTFCDCSQTSRHHLPTHVRPECQGLTRHHRIPDFHNSRNNWNSTHRNDFEASDRGSDILIEECFFHWGRLHLPTESRTTRTAKCNASRTNLITWISDQMSKYLSALSSEGVPHFIIHLNSALTWCPSSPLTWPRIPTKLCPTLKVRHGGRSLKRSKTRVVPPFFWAKLS